MRPGHGGKLEPITGQETRDFLDFSVNLNPFAQIPTDEQWLQWKPLIHRYPSPTPEPVSELLSTYLGTENSTVLACNGGMEGLRLALECRSNQSVIIPTPCFSEYPHICAQLKISHRAYPISPKNWNNPLQWLNLPLPENSTIMLSNPNNPTGIFCPLEILSKCIKDTRKKNITWIVDEAFIEFTDEGAKYSLMNVIHQHANLIVVGSLTKSWSIPGLRLGYVASENKNWMKHIKDLQSTWPLNALVQAWSEYFLTEHRIKEHWQSLQAIKAAKEHFIQALMKLQILSPSLSQANYFLCKIKIDIISKNALLQFLEKRGMRVRNCDNIPGMEGQDYIRIAIRTPSENQRLIDALTTLDAHSCD